MKNILFFTLSILLFSSCEDFFTTTIKVDPPSHEDQIVTSAFFSNNDTSLIALVNRSTAILENNDVDTRNLANASVRLFSGQELLTTLPYTENQFQFNHIEESTDVVFNAGQEYTLKVNHPDYEESSATIVVPNEVVPFRFELEEDAVVTKDYYQFARSIILQRNAEDFGPFSEPVAVKSNFENGLGLFAISFERVYPL